MFDFLTKKKNTEVAEGAAVAEKAAQLAEVAERSATEAPAAPPSSSSDWDIVDTPFHPPEAWNTESLTAPKPVQAGEVPQVGPVDPAKTAEFQQPIIDAIKTVFDPEIPVDIYELGLIYEIIVDSDQRALIRMTLTSPACPSAQQIPQEVRYKIKAIPGVADAWVEIVWEPTWTKDRMSEAAKLTLGMF